MKVLLSWSGTRSKKMALALHNWIPNVIQSVDPWMSESDIDIGSRWGKNLDKELEMANFGILCLTPERISNNDALAISVGDIVNILALNTAYSVIFCLFLLYSFHFFALFLHFLHSYR